jgi:hypothetical protein
MYFSPANSWSAKVPVMTSDGAIIWNYLGQIVCPIQLRVSMDEVIYWEKNVLKVMRNLSTVTGRQDAQTSQAEYENELHDWYELDNDIGYPGSFIDYLVSFNGFDLHWMNYIPYVAITLSNSASIGNFKWWLEFMNVIPINDPMPPDKHIADHPEAKKLSACQCILPPMGCHVGGSDIIAEECLKWPVFPKVMPCEDFGFTANHEDKNEFAGFFFECENDDDKSQALFSLNGLPVDCCRCQSPRETGDPQPGAATCPSEWTTGSTACDQLAIDCKNDRGEYSVTSSSGDPVCCNCDIAVPRPRRLIDNDFEVFRRMMQRGQTFLFLYLGSVAWMSDSYTESVAGAIRAEASMLELATQSCLDRAHQKYTLD